MIASVRQVYNDRALRSGDTFDANNEAEAADLVAVRMATRAKPAPARLLARSDAFAPALATRTLEATSASEPQQPEEALADGTPSAELNARSGYSRRDVRPKR